MHEGMGGSAITSTSDLAGTGSPATWEDLSIESGSLYIAMPEIWQDLMADKQIAINANISPILNFSISEAYSILLGQSFASRRIFSPGTEVLLVVLYVIITALGVISNLCVCCVMGRKAQRKIPRNLYVINLAVSDLAMSVFCTPFTLVLVLQRSWAMGGFLCRLLPVVQGANIMVSTATITVIAFDRYWTIIGSSVCPAFADSRWRRSLLVCLGIWILALTLAFPLAFFQVLEEVVWHKIVLWRTCLERWPYPRLRGYYTLGVMLVQYVIPISVLTVTHVQITRHLRVRNNRIAPMRAQRELERNRKATLTLLTIAGVFAASWFPLHVFSLLADFGVTTLDVVTTYTGFVVCHSCAMTSACSNPILYGWLNTNFREEALKIINQKCLPVAGSSDSDQRPAAQIS